MDDYTHNNIRSSSNPVKQPFPVGSNTVVVLDRKLVQILGINEDNTMLEEVLVDGGILLRVRRLK